MREAETSEKNKGHKKKRKSSFVYNVLSHKETLSGLEFGIAITFAFILDALRCLAKMLMTLICMGLVIGTIGGILVLNYIKPYYKEYKAFAEKEVILSSASTFRNSENSYIYDSNGSIIAKLKSDKDMEWVEYKNIPRHVVDAYVAVEDRTFWDNPGYDIKGIIRVGLNAVKTKGKEVHGASTITQQLARNIFLTHEVSLERKGKEILLAIELTKRYSKEQIMEFYINNICYANAYYGIGSAAKGYFNKEVKDLTLSEIAYLCAIPNSPSYYDPYKYPDRATVRRDKILDDMYELGYITRHEHILAKSEKIEINRPDKSFNDYQTTFALDCATKYFMRLDNFEFKYTFDSKEDYHNYQKDYSEAYENAKDKIYSGGYEIYTTLDSDIQTRVQDILNEQMMFDTEVDEETSMYKLQSASTVVDNNTGKVIAIVGGRTNEENSKNIYSLNRAYQSYRQPGSTIKPLIVYTPALEMGYTANSYVKNISISEAKETKGSLENLAGEQMTLRSALEQSKNGVAWWLMDKVTPKKGLSYLTNMNFSNIVPDDYFMASSLGGLTYGVTTVEMAGAYSSLENHGYWREPTCLSKIIDKNGNDIYRDLDGKQIYKEQSADKVVNIMQGVLTRGTAAKLKWSSSSDIEAAAKTGTTNNCKDGWLCGFTPYYTVSVWVGYDQPKTLNNLYGATYPGQIWKAIMLDLVKDKEAVKFENLESYDYEETISIYGENYYNYLPGRDDNEILGENYTVADYRIDRIKGETTNSLMLGMYYIDVRDVNYMVELKEQYDKAYASMNEIRSNEYKEELTLQALAVYEECMTKFYQFYGLLPSDDINNTEINQSNLSSEQVGVEQSQINIEQNQLGVGAEQNIDNSIIYGYEINQ